VLKRRLRKKPPFAFGPMSRSWRTRNPGCTCIAKRGKKLPASRFWSSLHPARIPYAMGTIRLPADSFDFGSRMFALQ
jgi:hypothetical protein